MSNTVINNKFELLVYVGDDSDCEYELNDINNNIFSNFETQYDSDHLDSIPDDSSEILESSSDEIFDSDDPEMCKKFNEKLKELDKK